MTVDDEVTVDSEDLEVLVPWPQDDITCPTCSFPGRAAMHPNGGAVVMHAHRFFPCRVADPDGLMEKHGVVPFVSVRIPPEAALPAEAS
jgi:hypothetical protein